MGNAMELLREWQGRLGLTDWRIKLNSGVREKDMPEENEQGHVNYLECDRVACVYLLAEEDYDESRILTYDVEENAGARTAASEILPAGRGEVPGARGTAGQGGASADRRHGAGAGMREAGDLENRIEGMMGLEGQKERPPGGGGGPEAVSGAV